MATSSSATSDIQSLVEQFTTQLTLMIRRSALESVLAAMGGGDSSIPGKRGPGRPRGSGRKTGAAKKSRGGKRSPEQMEKMTADLLGFIKANPGQRGEQIAAALRTDVKTMRLPLLKLIADKKVRTEGQRRGMTYFPGAGGGGGKKAARKSKGKKRGARKAKRAGKSARSRRAKARILVPAQKPALAPKAPAKPSTPAVLKPVARVVTTAA